MPKEGTVSGDYYGDRTFHDRITFAQGASGMGLQVIKDSQIWYVDGNKTGPAVSGDGLTWDKAFLTVTEGLAALGNYDILMIAPGNYNEAATLEITDLTGVKIFGFSSGMQWGEGNTVIGDEGSTNSDLVEISGCKGLEIAGLSFYTSGGTADAINFTGLNYSTEIHHCSFIGNVGGSDVMVNAIDIVSDNGPDTYIHHCKFDRIKTVAIKSLGQRNVVSNNVFIVGANCIGISETDCGAVAAFNIIKDNVFTGNTGASSFGIKNTSSTVGNFIIANNLLAGFNAARAIEVKDNGRTNCINNYINHATSGAITVADPTADS